MMKQIKYVLLFTILVLSSCQKDDDSIPNSDESNLTLSLEQIYKDSYFPGFTIGVVKNGAASYQKSFGLQDIENTIPYTNKTIQPIGSISKTFIAAAAVKAMALNYFTLDTPINTILQNPIVNPKNPEAEILVKHLLNHTSGLIDNEETYIESYYILNGQDLNSQGAQLLQDFGITQRSPKTLHEFITAYYYEEGTYYDVDNFINTTPGDFEHYSNISASLMAYIIEKASGIAYEQFLDIYIFNPLGMNNTSFVYDISNANYATLYFEDNIPLPFYGLESFPDGALKTSNEDMMKYMTNMIAGQRGETNVLFSEAHYELLFSQTSTNYTLFWDISTGNSVIGHGGSDPGLTTDFYFSGFHNAGFYLMTNYDSSTASGKEHYNTVFEQINESINTYLSN